MLLLLDSPHHHTDVGLIDEKSGLVALNPPLCSHFIPAKMLQESPVSECPISPPNPVN
jgi:hypothetical protein